jgi:hypothetical protein
MYQEGENGKRDSNKRRKVEKEERIMKFLYCVSV